MTITREFTYERTTKNTVRYQEVVVADIPVIGVLYVQKLALGSKTPQKITVTIEIKD